MKVATLLIICCICMVGCNGKSQNMANAVINAVPPDFGGLASSESSETIGEYTTKFDSQKSARGKNIMRASKAIDEIIVNPGQEFSFNNAVGPTTKSNGFELARIFIKGEEKKGYGGGVCQVSSTLYNAVLQAGLEVTERHVHSKEVFYVPKDKDAATSHGGIDFKFVNNKDFPIKIQSYTVDNKVTTAIMISPSAINEGENLIKFNNSNSGISFPKFSQPVAFNVGVAF